MDGLFAEDVLAGFRGLANELRVGVGAGANHHRVNVGVVENITGVGIGRGDVEIRGRSLGRLLEHISHSDQPRLGNALPDIFGMDATNATSADQAEGKLLCGHGDIAQYCVFRGAYCVCLFSHK